MLRTPCITPMPSIELRPITVDNWKACIALSVDASQQHFVPSNLYSIAEAQFYPSARSLAIYSPMHGLVGYVLYGIDVTSGLWKVFRLMIDQRYQRHGYGRAALRAVIAEIVAQALDTPILVTFHHENHAAHQLYRSVGFIDIDQRDDLITAQYRSADESEVHAKNT